MKKKEVEKIITMPLLPMSSATNVVTTPISSSVTSSSNITPLENTKKRVRLEKIKKDVKPVTTTTTTTTTTSSSSFLSPPKSLQPIEQQQQPTTALQGN